MPAILILTTPQTGYAAGDPELNSPSPTHTCSVHLFMAPPPPTRAVMLSSPWTKSSTRTTLIFKKEKSLGTEAEFQCARRDN
jgi:hypothetical protein